MSNFTRFIRKNFQCRFGIHWTNISDIGEEHDCPDCGKHFPAIKWPRNNDKNFCELCSSCKSTFPCDYTCGEGAEPIYEDCPNLKGEKEMSKNVIWIKDDYDYYTHKAHCCLFHGCKYNDEKCPVVNKVTTQDYLCEDCHDQGIKDIATLENLISGKQKLCPYCDHVI